MPRWLKLGAPILLVALGAAALAAAGGFVGQTRRDTRAEEEDASASLPIEPEAEAPRDAGVDASWRFDSRGRIIHPPDDEDYRCVQPNLDIPKDEACAEGRGYPDCRWQVPVHDELYTIWRNTVPRHRWGRPGLVSLVLAAAAEYQRRWPGERMAIGDLDAPGPRHKTHDRGVDVDLYLPHAMMTRNEGRRRYPSNYEGKSRSEVALLRARVMDLARILAVCANGQIRIYYNDPEIVRPFREWFEARGLRSSVGVPMRPHNRLHEFHFHLTIPEDFAPLPVE